MAEGVAPRQLTLRLGASVGGTWDLAGATQAGGSGPGLLGRETRQRKAEVRWARVCLDPCPRARVRKGLEGGD